MLVCCLANKVFLQRVTSTALWQPLSLLCFGTTYRENTKNLYYLLLQSLYLFRGQNRGNLKISALPVSCWDKAKIQLNFVFWILTTLKLPRRRLRQLKKLINFPKLKMKLSKNYFENWYCASQEAIYYEIARYYGELMKHSKSYTNFLISLKFFLHSINHLSTKDSPKKMLNAITF